MTKPTPSSRPSSPQRTERGRLRAMIEREQTLLDAIERAEDPRDALWALVQFYAQTNRDAEALERLGQMLGHATETEERALLLLSMGQCAEQLMEWERAIGFYERARALQPTETRVAYFVHNNLGFCLNQLGRFAEGEPFCRRAIEIDPGRANAFKNLGLSLAGLDRPAEAARAYLDATWANPRDARAIALLEALLDAHEELRPELEVEARTGAMMVAAARGEIGG